MDCLAPLLHPFFPIHQCALEQIPGRRAHTCGVSVCIRTMSRLRSRCSRSIECMWKHKDTRLPIHSPALVLSPARVFTISQLYRNESPPQHHQPTYTHNHPPTHADHKSKPKSLVEVLNVREHQVIFKGVCSKCNGPVKSNQRRLKERGEYVHLLCPKDGGAL